MLSSRTKWGFACAWVALLPVWWIVAWFWAVGLVDEDPLELGGAGPDVFDHVDTRMIVLGCAVLALASGLALIAVAQAGSALAARRRASALVD